MALASRQRKRFTPVNSGLKWHILQRLAAGCQGDYITASTQSSSLRIPQVLANDTDPIEVLEVGLPVMYYNPKSKTFENRAVKVDMQLSFFFILEERQLKQPVAVRLYEIDEVLSSTQAVEVLAEFNIHDEYATEATTTVIIHTRPAKDAALTLDRVLILLSPPAMKLHEYVAACVELSKAKFSADAGDEEGVRLKDSGRYLDCARIGRCGAVFFHYATGVDLEFTLRSADVVEKQDFEAKQPITHALHFPMEAVNVNTEIDKLVERLGILPELDMTRLRLVVYEMVLHRQWISPSIRLFAGGMYDFMQDHGGISAVFKVPLEVRQKLYEGVAPPRKKMDVHYYSHCALDGTILALKHLMSLEDLHAPLEEVRKATEEVDKAGKRGEAPKPEVLEKIRSTKVSTEPEHVAQKVRLFSRLAIPEADRRSYRSALRGSVFSDEESVREISAARRRSSSYHMIDDHLSDRDSQRSRLSSNRDSQRSRMSSTDFGITTETKDSQRSARRSSVDFGITTTEPKEGRQRSARRSSVDFAVTITEPKEDILEI